MTQKSAVIISQVFAVVYFLVLMIVMFRTHTPCSVFYILLTVHLGSILVNNQLDAHFFFRMYLFQFSTCFEHPCAHHQQN